MTFTAGYANLNIDGVMNDPLPAPRIIRGGEQVIPPRLTHRTYTDQLEADLQDFERRNARLTARVKDLEQLLADAAEEAAQLRSHASETTPVRRSALSLARQEAYRRARRAESAGSCVDLGQGVVFDPDGWRFRSWTGAVIRLSSNEGLLLRALLARRGTTVLYADIADAVWQGETRRYDQGHSINILSCRLRARLRTAGGTGLITTVPGIGLRLEVPA